MVRWLLLAGAAAVAVVLFVVLRPGDEGEATEGTTSAAETTATPGPTPRATARPTARPRPRRPRPAPITVVVRDGEVVGGVRRATVDKGGRAVLLVRSDVADEVHLHGYDRSAPVGPRKPARIAFRATLAGGFEVELEERGLQIAQIEVRP
jgi:hypothetical protein